MNIDPNSLVEKLISKGLSIDYYKELMEDVKYVNVSLDTNFQKKFNYFYKVRRDEHWRKAYYSLFEECKNKPDISFKEIITKLYDVTENIEASFSSKILATLKPEMPIWDQYVLKNCNFHLKGKTKDERLLDAINIYDEIVTWYDRFLTTDTAKESIRIFDLNMPNYQWLSDVKKMDFIIWGTTRN